MENSKKEITISKSLLISLGKKISLSFLFSFLFLIIVQHFGKIKPFNEFNYGNFNSLTIDYQIMQYESPIGEEGFNNTSVIRNTDFYEELNYSQKLFKIYIPDLFKRHKTALFFSTIGFFLILWFLNKIKSKYSFKLQ